MKHVHMLRALALPAAGDCMLHAHGSTDQSEAHACCTPCAHIGYVQLRAATWNVLAACMQAWICHACCASLNSTQYMTDALRTCLAACCSRPCTGCMPAGGHLLRCRGSRTLAGPSGTLTTVPCCRPERALPSWRQCSPRRSSYGQFQERTDVQSWVTNVAALTAAGHCTVALLTT